jgi:DNA-binding response OmpR family regulator
MTIVAVTTRPREIQEFLVELAGASRDEVEVETSGAGALERIRAYPPRLAVIDTDLPDFEALKLVVEIMKLSAMTLTAVVTDMEEDDFHEASEGFGVLKALPVDLKAEDAKVLAEALQGM